MGPLGLGLLAVLGGARIRPVGAEGVAAGPAARRRAALPAASPPRVTVRDAVAATLLAVVATSAHVADDPALARLLDGLLAPAGGE